jgi:hypothetical protein
MVIVENWWPNAPTFIIDFSNLQVGDRLILYSDAPAPYPGPDSRNDDFTGSPDQTAIGGARAERVEPRMARPGSDGLSPLRRPRFPDRAAS